VSSTVKAVRNSIAPSNNGITRAKVKEQLVADDADKAAGDENQPLADENRVELRGKQWGGGGGKREKKKKGGGGGGGQF